jgi:hypothetical protein
VFGVGLSELIFVEQWTYQNNDGEIGRFIGLYGSHRAAAAAAPVLNCWRATADKKPTASASMGGQCRSIQLQLLLAVTHLTSIKAIAKGLALRVLVQRKRKPVCLE